MDKPIFNAIKIVDRYPNKRQKYGKRYWKCQTCGAELMYFSDKCIYCKGVMEERIIQGAMTK